MKRLSAWNPLDQLRLLWWTLMDPLKLKAHRDQFGEKAHQPTAKWLVSTLTWLPFFLPFSAVGFEIVPLLLGLQSTLTTTHYLWASGGLFIAWFLNGVFGDRDNKTVGLAGLFAVILAAGLTEGLGGRLGIGLSVGLGVILATGLTTGLAIGQGAVLEAVQAIGLVAGLAIGLAIGVAGDLPVGLGIGLGAVLAVVLTALLAEGVENAVKESLKTGHASFLTKGAFGLLVAANAFLVWYSYLGGWRVF